MTTPKKSKDSDRTYKHFPMWMGIGIAFGFVMGILIKNLPVGIGMGISLGVAIGLAHDYRKK